MWITFNFVFLVTLSKKKTCVARFGFFGLSSLINYTINIHIVKLVKIEKQKKPHVLVSCGFLLAFALWRAFRFPLFFISVGKCVLSAPVFCLLVL